MKYVTPGLPFEIIDTLEHLGGRNDAEIQKIICEAPRNDFHRRARMARDREHKPVAA